MRSQFLLFNILLLAISGFVSCDKPSENNVAVSVIKASFPEPEDTKVAFSEQAEATGLDLTWESDDYLTVTGDATEKFSMHSFSGKNAEFKGNHVSGERFDVVLSRADDYLCHSYSGQVQANVASVDHLQYDACLKGVVSYSDISFTEEWAARNGGELIQNGCLMLHLKMPQEVDELLSLSLTAPEKVFYNTNSPDGGMTDELRLDFKDGTLSEDRIVKAYIMTSMQEAVIGAGMQLTLSATACWGVYEKKFTPGEVTLKSGKRNVIRLNSSNWRFIPAENVMSLRLLSYNVGAFSKHKDALGHYSYPEVASLIEEYHVSVVGMNETDNGYSRTGYDYQAREVAEELGTGWTYYFASAANDYYGNSILAAPAYKAVKEWPRLVIPKADDGREIRSMGAVEYNDFVFCVTHLDDMSLASRKESVGLITDWALENYGKGKTNKPVFLVGDFNCTPGEETIAMMRENWDWISSEVKTYPSPSPTKCIDYIFVLDNGVDYLVRESDSIVSDVADMASDHYPVYADVMFRAETSKGTLNEFDDNQVYKE